MSTQEFLLSWELLFLKEKGGKNSRLIIVYHTNNKNPMKKINLTILMVAAVLYYGCNTIDNGNNEQTKEIIELTDDGCWGYAGRFAYIANNKLFYSYLDTEGNNWVASYSFDSGNITRTNLMQVQRDLHSANPIMIRPDGRIQIFLDQGGYTGTNISWKTSKHPYSIESFSELQESEIHGDIIQGRQFYPMVHRSTGEVYLIVNALRDNDLRETVMWKSPDGGDTWSEYYNLWGLGKGLDGNRCYTRSYIEGDDIHIVTLRVGWGEELAGNNIGMIEGIYYTRFNVTDKAFYYSNGEKSFEISDTPVYETDLFDTVWDWQRDGDGTQRAVWSDIVADSRGNPYIAFSVQESVPQGESALHNGFRAQTDENGNWSFTKVATLARGWDNKPERKNYAIAIDTKDPNTIYVSESKSEDLDLSVVKKLTTADSGQSWSTSEVISDNGRVTTVVVPRILDKTPVLIDVLWLDGRMEGWRDYQTKIMARKETFNP